MTRPLRIFLCHASQDKPAVWKLYRYLKQHGVQPWLDQADLLPGQSWEVEIPKALFASDVILVCLSKNSVNKEGYVQKEIVFALDKALEKPQGTIFIIPLKLEECDVPKRLSPYQWVDYYRPEGRKRLLMGLNMRVNDLGSEVQQITLDDTRNKTPAPKIPKYEKPTVEESDRSNLSPKPEIKKPEKQIVSAPVTEKLKEEPKNEIPAKPFTKLLDPSSLSPKETLRPQRGGKRVEKRWLTIGGIVFIGLLFVLLGGKYLVSKFFSTPTLEVGSTTRGKDGMTLVYIPAGEFIMGSNDDGEDEQPTHTIYLNSFWIDQFEVTNTMYAKCVADSKCDPPSTTDHFSNSSYANHPVVYVNWNKASDYCLWAGRKLPTEAEWEKAARGTDANIYPWGNDAPNKDLLNYNSNVGDTTKTGSYETGKSFYGAYDMAGNVWEWVNDWYDETYYQRLLSSNPSGPNTGTYKVVRGGSWYGYDGSVRNTDRNWYYPAIANYNIGFRCAYSP